MVEVFLTVDVEIWCDGWDDIDRKFPAAFSSYVYGRTPAGEYGLPFMLETLRRHGLRAVFFVEPLFSQRFGEDPLREVVGLIRGAGQEVQLHLHTEWVDEARESLLPQSTGKRQHIRQFSLDEQTTLIGIGARLLREAGAPPVNAFRAGSFAMDQNTLRAVGANGIAFDSSYNASTFGPSTGIAPGRIAVDPFPCEGVVEYPMTVFRDGTGRLRQAAVTACSYFEMEGLLWDAVEQRRPAVVILAHNFEFLNQRRDRCDPVVVRRFEKLCELLAAHREHFDVRGFHGPSPRLADGVRPPYTSPAWHALGRTAVQAYRRIYG